MRSDRIEAIGIDKEGSLWVTPATATFPYVYREAMEVHWDDGRRRLYGPKPRELCYVDWFARIPDAARLQGVELTIEATTSWSNVENEPRQAIAASTG